MNYRKIATTIWNDNYFLELPDKEAKIFIYLFTNDKVNLVGIYELPDRIICSIVGATLQEWTKIKEKFERDRKYFFYKGWIYISNFAKHNSFSSAPNILNTFIKDFNAIPLEVKSHFLYDLKLPYRPTIKNKQGKDMVTVIVNVNVMVKYDRGYSRGYPIIKAVPVNEDIDIDEVIEDMDNEKPDKDFETKAKEVFSKGGENQ